MNVDANKPVLSDERLIQRFEKLVGISRKIEGLDRNRPSLLAPLADKIERIAQLTPEEKQTLAGLIEKSLSRQAAILFRLHEAQPPRQDSKTHRRHAAIDGWPTPLTP